MFSVLNYHPKCQVIIGGTNNGLVGFWDLNTGKLNGQFKEKKDDEITSISLIEKAYYILVCNSAGLVSLVAIAN